MKVELREALNANQALAIQLQKRVLVEQELREQGSELSHAVDALEERLAKADTSNVSLPQVSADFEARQKILSAKMLECINSLDVRLSARIASMAEEAKAASVEVGANIDRHVCVTTRAVPAPVAPAPLAPAPPSTRISTGAPVRKDPAVLHDARSVLENAHLVHRMFAEKHQMMRRRGVSDQASPARVSAEACPLPQLKVHMNAVSRRVARPPSRSPSPPAHVQCGTPLPAWTTVPRRPIHRSCRRAQARSSSPPSASEEPNVAPRERQPSSVGSPVHYSIASPPGSPPPEPNTAQALLLEPQQLREETLAIEVLSR